MEKIKRFYNQNRRLIYRWIIIIGAFILLTRVADWYYREKNEERARNILENKDASIVSNNNTSNTIQNNISNSSELNQFIEYCENNEYSNAYSMLSKETKENNLYSTEEAFINNFINAFIKTGDKLNIETINSVKKIYLVEAYQSNMLSTGSTSSAKIGYIKIENKKINIQDYIAEEDIEAKYTNEDYFISIKKVKLYKDYIEFKVMVTNNSNINLDIQDTYVSSKSEKYSKLDSGNIVINSYESETLNLKYKINYKKASNVDKIAFEINDNKIEIQL